MTKSLNQIVSEKPFADYRVWWSMGQDFIAFMSNAIVSEWRALHQQTDDFTSVQQYVALYLQTVFDREMETSLVHTFVENSDEHDFQSGEFDAISYAFYRSAFECIADQIDSYDNVLEIERRRFTERVGAKFFQQVSDSIALSLPQHIRTEGDFDHLQAGIKQVGDFLSDQGYLRDGFGFTFEVSTSHGDQQIRQTSDQAYHQLKGKQVTYALYEMGYPVILPSAVYLYHTVGEAQHHSSRTIEELFRRVGFLAYETDDFDPTDYPSDKVVELWEIKPLAK